MTAMSDPIEETQITNPSPSAEDENLSSQTQPVSLESSGTVESIVSGATTMVQVNQPETLASNEEPPSVPAAESAQGYEDTSAVVLEPAAPPPGETIVPSAGAKTPPQKKPAKKTNAKGSSRSWIFYALIGLMIMLAFLLVSGFGGYSSGIHLRKSAEKTQVAQVAVEQFQLGIQDMEQGAFSRARQRFEYVIRLDPGYPGASEKLAEVLLEINTTATPTLLPTITPTPTPDIRDAQQFFDNAQQALAASDWNSTIESLLTLRKADASFHAVDVDGMLFLALRNRGRDKILKDADLEGGIYDLTLAKKFGPLDAEADGLLSWSSMYITGASFWGIDWEQAVSYFTQVAPQLPNLTDGSGMTATERLRVALFEYGNTLAAGGQYCKAVRAYQDSIAIAPNPDVQQAGEIAAKGCEQGDTTQAGKTPKPGKKPKTTPSP